VHIHREEASIIVFSNKKFKCDRISQGLSRSGWPAVAIHGDKEQWERTKALEKFTKGEVQIIVATDVAARGLDIKGVSHVINYDFPDNGVEDWVHRVGRTGR
jgi:ATP-dependent RNA helicase DDX5/DBP2